MASWGDTVLMDEQQFLTLESQIKQATTEVDRLERIAKKEPWLEQGRALTNARKTLASLRKQRQKLRKEAQIRLF